MSYISDGFFGGIFCFHKATSFPDAKGFADTANVLCFGRVGSPTNKGSDLAADLSSVFAQLTAKVPTITKQKLCNYAVYSPGCGVSKAAFTSLGTIGAHIGSTITLTGLAGAAVPANWFAGGHVWLGAGTTYQSRTVTASTASAGGALTLTVNVPFNAAPVGGLSIAPHCDRTRDHCKNRFNNWPNALIFEWTPNSNPSLVSKQTADQGGKK